MKNEERGKDYEKTCIHPCILENTQRGKGEKVMKMGKWLWKGLHPPLHLAKKQRGKAYENFRKPQKGHLKPGTMLSRSYCSRCYWYTPLAECDFWTFAPKHPIVAASPDRPPLCWVWGCRRRGRRRKRRCRRRRKTLLSWMQVSMPFTFWGAAPFSSKFLIFV